MTTKKAKNIFDLMTDLTYNKVKWVNQSDSDRKEFTPFMINRFFSMNMELVEIVNYIQQYTNGQLTPKETYNVYLDILPKKKMFSKYISGGKNKSKYHQELISKLCDFNNWSETETIQNLDILKRSPGYTSMMTLFLKQFGKTDDEVNKIIQHEEKANTKSTKKHTKKR